MEAFQGVIFDSHDEFFRHPQGAIPCGGTLTLRVLVSRAIGAYGVTVRIWENNEEKLLNMTKGGFFSHTPYGDFLDEYAINVSRETIGLSWYQFMVNTSYKPLYICNSSDGLGGRGEISEHLLPEQSFQITTVSTDFFVPEWARGAIMYQIFPDRFFRDERFGDTAGKRMHEKWDEAPEWQIDPQKGYYPANDFFGGNLKGIEAKLDYLEKLHVDVLYLNPIFKAYSNHRYDTGDYESVDPLLGTNGDLASLCREAKKRGIRVILDGVFSHTGSDSKYFDREGNYGGNGAYNTQASPYYEWYSFKNYPDEYDSWWGVWSLPCVNELAPPYLDYILKNPDSIVKRWLNTGISGWRLDVADELPDEFIRILRENVKSTDPDALILGEVWEDASTKFSYGRQREFLYGNELDTVMNYPLRNAIVDYLLMDITGEEFARRVLSLRENYPTQTFECLMNFLSTHDLERITTHFCGFDGRLSREEQSAFDVSEQKRLIAKGLHKLAALLLFALPGMPCIYYGDEVGLEGCKDPFNRGTFPWGNEDAELLAWYQTLAEMHDDEVFRRGKLYIDAAGSLLSVRRVFDGKWRYVLINPSDETVETLLDITYFKSAPVLLCDSGCGMQFSERENGYYLLLPPRSGVAFKAE